MKTEKPAHNHVLLFIEETKITLATVSCQVLDVFELGNLSKTEPQICADKHGSELINTAYNTSFISDPCNPRKSVARHI